MGLLEPGVLLGKYVIIRFVAAGGMCLVYEARPEGESQSVAIKVLHDMWAADEEIRRRFMNEAFILETMHHPHVVSAIGSGTLPSGEPYMVLKWLPFSLQSVLEGRNSGLEPFVVARLSAQLARALVFLHEQNIVHRDIKAANVLLDDDDLTKAHVRLADLGLAKVAPERRSVLGMQVSTGARARFGTWDYMAPEQWIRAKEVDPKTDVYALGILIFQMISGQLPFVADDAKNLMRMHLFVEAPMVRLRGRVPEALFHLVGRMLRKTFKERPTMHEVFEQIETMPHTNG